ncbi:hypothetical protein DHW03_16655 [Pedobacter yonginense]|uniref:DUF268 domain-containing protein n=1 Tax=Pedobacter yonginense TaxID=651869 RepID=A0A317EHY0_9SPHI|nr:DUF268 domain-containing protein [Pedobacter yonginense]PWS26411.1 hypothetical protein DHW03_16655 [Pedobacter yonginense]
MNQKIKLFIKKSLVISHFYRASKSFLTEKKYHQEFKKDLEDFKKSEALSNKRFDGNFKAYPILTDKTSFTNIEPHYTYHPAWAARILAQTKPMKHVDISSTLNFCTLVSAFIPFEFYDYRPASLHLSNLKSAHADLTNLHFESNSIPSLSCMHTVEHVGLGRYGDPIDYDGDLKAMSELIRVLAEDGDLLVVFPIGKAMIAYNAHRIYSYEQILSYFKELKLIEFSLIPDDHIGVGIIKDATKEQSDAQNWGCGCFWFKKTKN